MAKAEYFTPVIDVATKHGKPLTADSKNNFHVVKLNCQSKAKASVRAWTRLCSVSVTSKRLSHVYYISAISEPNLWKFERF